MHGFESQTYVSARPVACTFKRMSIPPLEWQDKTPVKSLRVHHGAAYLFGHCLGPKAPWVRNKDGKPSLYHRPLNIHSPLTQGWSAPERQSRDHGLRKCVHGVGSVENDEFRLVGGDSLAAIDLILQQSCRPSLSRCAARSWTRLLRGKRRVSSAGRIRLVHFLDRSLPGYVHEFITS